MKTQEETLKQKAREILQKNTQTGEKDGKTYTFGVPSLPVHPFQWTGWDSQFHAIVWAVLGDTERAKQEIRSIFTWQNKDKNSPDYGHIPHVVFYDSKKVFRSPLKWHWLEGRGRMFMFPFTQKPKSTYHIQPPVLAQAVDYVVKASGDESFLIEALDVLEPYYKWFAQRRDPDNDNLISIIAQFESGIDYSPAYDILNGYNSDRSFLFLKVLSRLPSFYHKLFFNLDLDKIFKYSPFHQEDVLVNSVYAKNLYVLADLAEEAGREELAGWAKQQAQATQKALIEKCYDGEVGLFWNLVGPKERKSKTKTILSLMPLILPNLPKEIIDSLVSHLKNPNEFWTEFPIASVALDEKSFRADPRSRWRNFIWRGPLSMNTNWFLAHGLRQHGYNDIADEIAQKSKRLICERGFHEFYNPTTGKIVGAEDFGWATLVVDM